MAARRMSETLERLGSTGDALVASGPPVQEILSAAERLAADVVVVGSRDESAILAPLRSRVAERVAARAACSVLAVKSQAAPSGGTESRAGTPGFSRDRC